MRTFILAFLFLFSNYGLFSQTEKASRQPIIDMHLHGYTSAEYWGGQNQQMGQETPKTAEELLNQIIALMDQHNIQLGMVSGSPEALRLWKAADKRFIGGYEYLLREDLVDTTTFKQLIEEGLVQVFGEMGSVYRGTTLNDPKFEPYIKICERYGIPIGYHTGGAPPGFGWHTPYRLQNADPLLIEEVLARHPKLKVYLMHAGGHYYPNAVEMMSLYPTLYVDIAGLLWVANKTQYQMVEFLKYAKEAKLLDRVMFGTDPMVWPGAITASIDFLNSLDFLTEAEKRDIFHNNAARFLGLSEEEIARHHGK